MHRPITVLLAEMTACELTLWWQVYQSEFLGADRDYFAATMVQAEIINMAGRSLADGESVSAVEIMPFRQALDDADEVEDEEAAGLKVGFALMAVMGRQQAALVLPQED